MSVKIDKTLCIGCGACMSACPKAFNFGSDGLAELMTDEVLPCAQDAVDICPTAAISIE